MSNIIINMKCPNCGASVSLEQGNCIYCKQPLVFVKHKQLDALSIKEVNKQVLHYKQTLLQHPNNLQLNHSIGLCFMKLGLYGQALDAFKKAMVDNFECSESFFYAAVCLLNGKKAFLHTRSQIDEIISYINAAMMIDDKAIYEYFLAYIKYDYFERKNFNIKPNYIEHLKNAYANHIASDDITSLFTLIGTEIPEALN